MCPFLHIDDGIECLDFLAGEGGGGRFKAASLTPLELHALFGGRKYLELVFEIFCSSKIVACNGS